ncbi:MAG: signal peptidase II, partial [Gammaproteobacteria bacterium]
LILGGAAGNLIDRVVYGYVIDFIDVYYGAWHWPTFNIADSSIFIGAVLLLLDAIIDHRKNQPS